MKTKLKAQYLNECLTVAKQLADEVLIDVTADGFYSRVVDSAHVAMAEISLPKTAFQKYELDEKGNEALGLNLELIMDKYQTLKKIWPEQIIGLQTSQKGSKNYVTFIDRNLAYKHEQLDTSALSKPKIPNLNLPAWAKMPVDELRRACKAAECVSDHIILKICPEGFILSAHNESDDIEFKLLLAASDFSCEGESYKSMFPLDYFSNMIQSIPSSQKQMKIYLANDYPVKLEYGLSNGGKVMALIAPRI